MTTDMAYRILIAAGGTGGHVFPAIAIADALRDLRPSTQITFVGTKDKIEWHAVPTAGFPIRNIWISGFHRRFTWQNLLFPFKLITSIIQSFRIVADVNPHLFVSCGGYVAGPAGWVAERKGIPTVIQEQNSFPGVTNRMLAKRADVIYTAFVQADQWLPAGKTNVMGNPTRKTLTSVDRDTAMHRLGLDPLRKTLLVLGGSGGAKSINDAMVANLDALHNEMGIQIMWQAGTKYITALRDQIPATRYSNLTMTDFIYDMPAAYAAADLVVSRAGASSCAELMLTGKPCVLIPSPHVAGNHQMMNAKAMAESGAAVVLADTDASSTLASVVGDLIADSDTLAKMAASIRSLAAPDAALNIANDIFNRLDKKHLS
jgi:UDP-N-acetylglucosamine--N-acetylmuramyl-(pentapeptide) pyrophosphoryl-undecaprenol N-acetylglucosamine transferase